MKKKKEMLDVENKVDRQIESMTANLVNLQKHSHISKFKDRIFTKNQQESVKKNKPTTSKILEIAFNNDNNIQDFYDYHFKLTANPELIVKEKRTTIKQKIEEQTR